MIFAWVAVARLLFSTMPRISGGTPKWAFTASRRSFRLSVKSISRWLSTSLFTVTSRGMIPILWLFPTPRCRSFQAAWKRSYSSFVMPGADISTGGVASLKKNFLAHFAIYSSVSISSATGSASPSPRP